MMRIARPLMTISAAAIWVGLALQDSPIAQAQMPVQSSAGPAIVNAHAATQIPDTEACCTLAQSLAAFGRAHHVEIVVQPGTRTDARAAVVNDRQSPERILRTLLRSYDYFLQYSSEGDTGESQLARVWVFPRSQTNHQWLVRDNLVAAPCDGSPGDVASELREAMGRSPAEAAVVFAQALQNEDENVRRDALQAAVQVGLPVAPSQLEYLLQFDSAEAMRAAAFEALVARAGADGLDVNPVIEIALRDPSPTLQMLALAAREAAQEPVAPHKDN